MTNPTPHRPSGAEHLWASRVVIVAGKGGVGTTTVTAAIARAAADAGLSVLAVDLDGAPTLARLLPGIDVRHLSAADALEEYLLEHGFRRIAKRLVASGVVDVVATAAPGIDDLVVLGKLKQIERSGNYDLVVVDGPASGHAITMLTSAAGLRDAVRGGPIAAQADEVLAMLADPERARVVLVTLPEQTPVSELLETVETLERRVAVRIGGIVVNRIVSPDPALDRADFGRRRGTAEARSADAVAAAAFQRARANAQVEALERLRRGGSIDTIELPALPTADVTPADIAALASRLAR